MIPSKEVIRVAEVTYGSYAQKVPLGPALHGPLLKLEAAAEKLTKFSHMLTRDQAGPQVEHYIAVRPHEKIS